MGIDVVFDGPTVEVEDERLDYGEARFLTVGLIGGPLVVVAHTARGSAVRIIAARKATRSEALFYIAVAHGLGEG